MKIFYGQMTQEELKGAVYSGEHLKEFADMCDEVGSRRVYPFIGPYAAKKKKTV